MLNLRNLTYHPPASAVPILNAISLELAPQELGLIIGSSGSGKTTLLELLAGLAEQTNGEICWRDRQLVPDDLQQMSGLVFQFPERHFCGSTVLEELRLGHPEINSEQIQNALKEVGLADIPLQKSPFALSGGQQRRLALAVQLVRQPSLLLLDEPTAGLDWSMRQQVVQLIANLRGHWTCLVVTHDTTGLLEIADRGWRITSGRVERIKPA